MNDIFQLPAFLFLMNCLRIEIIEDTYALFDSRQNFVLRREEKILLLRGTKYLD